VDSGTNGLFSSAFGTELNAMGFHYPDFSLKRSKSKDVFGGYPVPEICELPRRTLSLLLMHHPSPEALMERDGFEPLEVFPVDSELCYRLRKTVANDFVELTYEQWISTSRFIIRRQRRHRRVDLERLLSIQGVEHYLDDIAEEFGVSDAKDLPKSDLFRMALEMDGSSLTNSIDVIHSVVRIDSAPNVFPATA
jgi:hypothetical protein